MFPFAMQRFWSGRHVDSPAANRNNSTQEPLFEEDRKVIMAATREDVIEFLKNMTLLEASQLVKDLEETFGVSAAAAAVAAPAAVGGGGGRAAPTERETQVYVGPPARRRY